MRLEIKTTFAINLGWKELSSQLRVTEHVDLVIVLSINCPHAEIICVHLQQGNHSTLGEVELCIVSHMNGIEIMRFGTQIC